jgi:hypothetical protein
VIDHYYDFGLVLRDTKLYYKDAKEITILETGETGLPVRVNVDGEIISDARELMTFIELRCMGIL